MPTDLPPDYKPKPAPPKGPEGDAENPGLPSPGSGGQTGGVSGPDGDVIDPGAPKPPPAPDSVPGMPAPAGTTTF